MGYRCFDQRRSTTPSAGVRRLAELLSGAGGGALAGSALALLLGSKKARKVGGKALTYGSLAALGMLAYKAYNNWQAQQDGAQQREPQPLDRLPEAQAEERSQAILKALVAAAKADGHVDDRERALIEGEFARLDNDPELQRWLHAELNKPLDPADVARAALDHLDAVVYALENAGVHVELCTGRCLGRICAGCGQSVVAAPAP